MLGMRMQNTHTV